ncbi:unnamed protein product [Prunus armeniaca]|uniref:Uncharacterized protein n=1 Tax=Prunus armeniaca TaxID=36596 RepID=A0A6J5VVE4_PRUAR|nr:unnamed protein product [Prunus armeniaca]CAB4292021.1 unnamed protein product [Prunus armeniaca]
MQNLINPRHVYFDEYVEVAFGMRRLTHLQTLPSLTLDNERNHGIDELGGLNQLEGELSSRFLEHARETDEIQESNLAGQANYKG